MEKTTNFLLMTALGITVLSCKKETKIDEKQNLLISKNQVSTLPGASTGYPIAPPDANGYQQSSWRGVGFTSIVKSDVYNEGQAVESLNAILPPESGITGYVTSVGPYVILAAQQLSGLAKFQNDYSKFNTAYQNYFFKRTNGVDGPLLQPTMPNVRDFISNSYTTAGGWVEVIFKGIVVRSSSAPSTLVVMPDTFTPTAPGTPLPIEGPY